MSQQFPSQLDIVLWNSNEVIIDCGPENLLHISLTRNNKYFSDHSPLRSEILLNVRQLPNAAAKRYAFKKTDWQKFNESIENESFQPYCYSNVDYLVNLWYEWLWEKIDANVPSYPTPCCASALKSKFYFKLWWSDSITRAWLHFSKKSWKNKFPKKWKMIWRNLKNQVLRADLSVKFSGIWKESVKLHPTRCETWKQRVIKWNREMQHVQWPLHQRFQ